MEAITIFNEPRRGLYLAKSKKNMEDQVEINQFRKQIAEDIELIQKKYNKSDHRLRRNEYAFNFWILENIYSVDEEYIPSQITDRNDKAIDCYVHYPESKVLYLIQNKYYDEKTNVSREDVTDFLTTPLDHLMSGIYKKSPDLQKLFNIVKEDKEYKFYLHFYVTNSRSGLDIDVSFKKFNSDPKYKIGEFIRAEFIKIGELYDKYYGYTYKEEINYKYTLRTKVAKNILNILPEDYKLPEMSKAYYMLTPVWQIWEMMKEAKAKKYPLFEENIREYLGDNDINGSIIKTLNDPKDRSNFFYYNNGITIICDNILKPQPNILTLMRPQIINGCQTVNSIFECLEDYGTKENIEKEFKDVFVMSKLLLFDIKTKEKKTERFYNDIVKYNNKQNPLNEKAFASKKPFFAKIQSSLRSRGFLLLRQPSDKNKFINDISQNETAGLLKTANLYSSKIGIELSNKKDLFIPLEKLLQVYLAFVTDGFNAFTKKSNLLKEKSEWYKIYSLRVNQLSTDSLIMLWLIYLKAEKTRDASEDQTTPIPYYLIGFLGYLIKDETKKDQILQSLFESENAIFNNLFEYLTKLTTEYKISYLAKENLEYNSMIKDKIDTEILDSQIATLNRIAADKNLKVFLNSLNT